MITVKGSFNRYYKNKKELVDDLIDFNACNWDREEEEEIAKSEGFNSLYDKLLSWKTQELVEYFQESRGV